MPEPGGVGGASGSSSSSSSSNSSQSSDESKSSSSKSSETKTESIANSPTTEERLGGGGSNNSKDSDTKSESKPESKSASDIGSSDSDSDNNTTSKSAPNTNDTPSTGTGSLDAAEDSSSNSNNTPAAGTGSLDAAVASSARSIGVEPLSLDDVVTSSPADTESPPENNAAKQNQSLTTIGSVIGDSLEGSINIAKNGIDRTALEAAGDLLGSHPSANLPAKGGFGSQGKVAERLTQSPLMDATKALKETPFGPNAKSTQILSEAAQITKPLGKVASTLGNAVAPAIGLIEGATEELPADATVGDRIANTLGGALKEADDGLISGGMGFGAATLQTAGGLAATATGVGAPVGAAMVATAPVTGTATAVATSLAYDNGYVDNTIDNFVDNTVEPAVAGFIDGGISVVNTVTDTVSDAADWAGNKASGVKDTVQNWFK